MKANIELELQSFTVPNYVLVKEKPGRREEGFQEGMKFHLSELDSITLCTVKRYLFPTTPCSHAHL